MELLFGMFTGFFALSVWWMLAIVAIFLVDVVLCEKDEFGWGTGLLMAGTALVAWLGAEVNAFLWVWENLAAVVKFSMVYFFIGAIWSFVKWYFYLIKVRDHHVKYEVDKSPERPKSSFAKNNKARLMGWVAHWPFSAIGFFLGDMLRKVVEGIFNVLKGAYERVGDYVFKDFGK
jgi:hypothetical protein